MISIEELEREVDQRRSEGDPAALAGALRASAEAHRKNGNEEAALGLYEESVQVYREIEVELRLAHALRHLGMIHEDAGRNRAALKCYEEALEIYKASPSPGRLDLANAVRALAFLKSKLGDKGATSLWKEARPIYEELGIEEGVAECDGFIG